MNIKEHYVLNLFLIQISYKKILFQAILSIPTPDGLVLTYSLKGIAKSPLPAGKITREIQSKIPHLEQLNVKNWLSIKQQFNVTTSLKNSVFETNMYVVKGNSLIDVLPNATRIYNWSITAINEGPLELRITFTNKNTNEYLYYDVFLNVMVNNNLQSLDFITCVRTPITKLVTLENPLNIAITYNIACTKDFLSFRKSLKLEPHTSVIKISILFKLYVTDIFQHQFEIIYNPLKPEQITERLEAFCMELSSSFYNLNFVAHPPIPEAALVFQASLGEIVSKMFRIPSGDVYLKV